MFILDTDHVSFVLSGDRNVISRLDEIGANAATTIITVQEIFNGWISELNRPKASKEDILKKYHRLYLATELFRKVRVLEFDERAYEKCIELLTHNEVLRKSRLKQDLKIASIALTNGATIVTRNHRDFNLVPGLSIENWIQ